MCVYGTVIGLVLGVGIAALQIGLSEDARSDAEDATNAQIKKNEEQAAESANRAKSADYKTSVKLARSAANGILSAIIAKNMMEQEMDDPFVLKDKHTPYQRYPGKFNSVKAQADQQVSSAFQPGGQLSPGGQLAPGRQPNQVRPQLGAGLLQRGRGTTVK